MSSIVRFGLVGCGRIAVNHAEALAASPNTELVACCDTDRGRAAEFAVRHGIGHAVSSVEELLDLGVDAVTVCTPHPSHEEVVVTAAKHGSHVLCEKPIAVDVAAADRMVEAADTAGVSLGVLFQRRFWPAVQRIRAAIDDGRIGRPVLGECQVHLHRPTEYYTDDPWRGRWDSDGGGVLMTQAIHQIDQLQWLMGEVTHVSGFMGTLRHGDHIEVEDTAVAVLRFVGGGLATISASTASGVNFGNRITVTGESGASAGVVEFPEGAEGVNDVWTVPGEHSYDWARPGDLEPNVSLEQIHLGLLPFHARQIQDFVTAVRDGRPPAVTGREARKSLAIVAAIYESARTGTIVALDASESETSHVR